MDFHLEGRNTLGVDSHLSIIYFQKMADARKEKRCECAMRRFFFAGARIYTTDSFLSPATFKNAVKIIFEHSVVQPLQIVPLYTRIYQFRKLRK